jgi:predicted membrane channel-forming protein YqfA (hemolysin III family)
VTEPNVTESKDPNIQSRGNRLAAILWSVAAALALIAVVIRYVDDREIKWPHVVLAITMSFMAVTMMRKAR